MTRLNEGENMFKYFNFILIILFLSNINLLEARKLKLKPHETTEKQSSAFGGLNFINELDEFNN